jgi:hypothetical protein
MLKDLIKVLDSGVANLRTRTGAIIAGRSWDDLAHSDEPVISVKGWVTAVMRERGKIVPGSLRTGHNIWTNTGKEFLALLMSLETLPTTPFRNDRIAYIGVGTGSQLEDVSVLSLAEPAAYTSGLFLAALDVPPTFPLNPTRTTVKYHRTFAENEITLSPGSTVDISEIGLFTNGDPASSYAPGTRDLTLAEASSQAPNAYKTFEPVGKTDALQLDLSWEIRF